MYQENTPSMIIPGQDAPSTHFMESADNIVYPTVVQMPDGTLQYLGDDAYNYAVESGEYIEFPNPRQARRFGKSYKKGTGVLKQKDGAQRGKEITPYESSKNAKALYDPVYNKVAKAYGYDPESSSTFLKLLNDERIDKYVRSGIEEAYGYSINDFESGRRRVPPLEGDIKDFQKLILNASDEELRNLLKKDYSDIGLTNFKSYLPEQLSYWDAAKYMKKFYDYIGEGYTFQEGGETDPKFLQNKVVERFATGDKLPYKPGKGPTRPNKYTVQTGDTLYGIARKKDTSVKDLESWNKDLEPNKLKAGQIINLPTGSPDVPMGITSELLRRQAFKESSFDPNAISKSGYKGLGQIGDAVISDYLKRNKLEGEIDPFDPKQNSDVQKWYMDQLYNAAFIKKGNPSDKVRVAKALAAYNAGPGTLLEVLEDQKKKGVDIYNSLDWLQAMPKEETRGYIKAILLGEDEKFEKWYDDAKKNPENKKYLDLFNKAQDGAEITLMDLYKGYIYDQFTDKAMQQKAKNAYDKLNRVYYRDAKAAGMSVPNYIMTNMNKL